MTVIFLSAEIVANLTKDFSKHSLQKPWTKQNHIDENNINSSPILSISKALMLSDGVHSWSGCMSSWLLQWEV